MASDISRKVIEILAEQALVEPSDISPGQKMDDLGIDSLGLVEAIYAIEEAFDIKVPFNANQPGDGGLDISSVGAVIRAVEGLVAAQK